MPWIVYARGCGRRQLAMVWSHIQQWYDFFSQSPLLMTEQSLVVRDFGFTLDEVNWLGNIISLVYLPTAVLTPIITKRYGLKRCVCSVSFYALFLLILLVQCSIASSLVLLSAWF